MIENQKLFALLIDGDNAMPSLMPQILDKIGEYGNAAIRRVYGNQSAIKAWEKMASTYSLENIFVPNNAKGKNATDISLVIAAMHLLYNQPEITDFCIVSSDGDFTELASDLKKETNLYGVLETKEHQTRLLRHAPNLFLLKP